MLRRAAAAAALLLAVHATAAAPLDLAAPAVERAPIIPDNCIKSAAEFVQAFAACKPIACVSPCLFVNLQTGACGNSSTANGGYRPTLANTRRVYSFISGADGLERYARFQATGACNKFDAVADMLRWVGFPDSFINPTCSYRLAVFEGRLAGSAPGSCDVYSSRQGAIWEPTWVQMAGRLRDTFDLHLSFEVIKELTLNNLDWSASTGCGTRENIFCGSKDPGMQTCSPAFLSALDTVCPAYSAGGTRNCTAAFKARYGGDGSSAPVQAARAMLAECFGANSYFSGWGFGWNPKLGWTSAEYLVDNLTPEDLGASFVDLSFGRANRFRCVPGVATPVRLAASGDPECLSTDGKNCVWGQSAVDCLALATTTNPDVAKALRCGAQYQEVWGNDGYGPDGWCSKAKAAL
ncbi:hypothetical protein DFJ74DRAFT_663099 [Hyaloraphidium curvatum]|nr:hypothetical protein DFJ74DRAFT_663099 [Hyaloraphidium curvatum]